MAARLGKALPSRYALARRSGRHVSCETAVTINVHVVRCRIDVALFAPYRLRMAGAVGEDLVAWRGHILVVEDEFLVARTVSQWVLAAGWTVHIAETVSSSLSALREPCDGAVVDLELPDGSGFDVIEAARSNQPDLHVLVMTGRFDPESSNRAQEMGIEYACKPARASSVTAFLNRCWATNPQRVGRQVAELVEKHHLTPAHGRLLRAAVASAARHDLSERLGVSVYTVKAQVHEILARTYAASLEELVSPIRTGRRG
jgi:DNA-binding response OmpR family regulator